MFQPHPLLCQCSSTKQNRIRATDGNYYYQRSKLSMTLYILLVFKGLRRPVLFLAVVLSQ